METFILRENVLTDNVLFIASKGKIFKGGYVAILKEHTFLNAWNDKETVKRFKNYDTMKKYINKKYTIEETENVYY